MKNVLFLLGCLLFLTASSCDKEPAPSGPSDEDLARCAHIIDNGFLHQVCLNHPWPTELPPATQEGLSTFGGIINDTLIFVAGSPRSFSYETAYAKRTYLSSGGIDDHRLLIGGYGTWDEIDPSEIGIRLPLEENGKLSGIIKPSRSRFRISNHVLSIDGTYVIDTSRSVINITRWDDDIVAGTIEAWFIHPDESTRQIHLTEGRFDLTVRS